MVVNTALIIHIGRNQLASTLMCNFCDPARFATPIAQSRKLCARLISWPRTELPFIANNGPVCLTWLLPAKQHATSSATLSMAIANSCDWRHMKWQWGLLKNDSTFYSTHPKALSVPVQCTAEMAGVYGLGSTY